MRNDYKFKYVGSTGRVLDLSGGGIDAHGGGLPAWSFEALTLNGRVAGLKKQLPVYSIPLVVVAEDAESGIEAKNALHEIPAIDIDRNSPGRLYFNDWYIEGFMTASEVTNFWQLKRAAQYELTFTATEPKWVRETQRSYENSSNPVGIYLDYPHDFAYDFGVSEQVFTITNENYVSSPIMLRIFGATENPHITIGGNDYIVNATIGAGEYLEVDGMAHSVTLIRANGERESAFKYVAGDFREGSGSYIFEPIRPGVSEVVWPGTFDFDLVEFEQRSEPRWS